MKPFPHHPLSSRSTELLIDLEDGVNDGHLQNHSPLSDGMLVNLEDKSASGSPLGQASSNNGSPLLLHSPVAIHLESDVNSAEIPRTATNNSWRQWEQEDRDLLSMDADYDLARFDTFETDWQTTDPFGDLFPASRPAVSVPEDPFIESSAPLPSSVKGGAQLELQSSVGVKSSIPSEPVTPSQMPTPPASPPFSLLRMPSTSSHSPSPVETSEQEHAEDPDMAVLVEAHSRITLDLEEGWEEVPKEQEVAAIEEPLEPAAEEEETSQEEIGVSSEDDPPLPELPLLKVEDIRQEVAASDIDERESEGLDNGSFDDPPLPEFEVTPPVCSTIYAPIEEAPAELVGNFSLPSLPTSPVEDKERPAWSLRASEAPRLGLVAEAKSVLVEKEVVAQDSSTDISTGEVSASESTARYDSIPGAFPIIAEAEPSTQPTAVVAFPEAKPSASTLALSSAPPRRRTTSTIDTSSFAAAIVSLRRKPEPLDVALAMQMRPGVGAGADPAWMVRFMMAVFGWLAVTVSAGID